MSNDITESIKVSALHKEYVPTIGIECHVQLKTVSKLFSGADNNAKEAPPNTLINHIDLGLPGALPVLNEQAVILAIKAAKALNSRAANFSKFDRKHYFYPDLPMGYQISQYDEPIILGGYVNIYDPKAKQIKRINITRAHLEADAGKNIHPDKKNYSLVDLNRAGTPLLEIVSEPDMHSAEEARLYAEKLYLLMRYADVTEGNLYYGNMRFDVNVSISKTNELGTRAEIKNLNSFRSVERAVNYEIIRQAKLLEEGERIVQETRGFNDQEGTTYSLRSKENADDYRYMPDPDIPPVILADNYIDKYERETNHLPDYYIDKLRDLGVDEVSSYILLDYELEEGAGILEYVLSLPKDSVKPIVNWIINIESPIILKLANITNNKINKVHSLYEELLSISKEGLINSNSIKELIKKLFENKELPKDLKLYIQELGLIQNSDTKELELIVKKVVEDNQKAFNDLKNGEQKVIGFLIGQVMKMSKGNANPSIVKELIEKLL